MSLAFIFSPSKPNICVMWSSTGSTSILLVWTPGWMSLSLLFTDSGFVSYQSTRRCPPLVPHPPQSCETPGVWPVQVADHQNRRCSPAAGHLSSVPLQHAWLHGEEDVGSLSFLLQKTPFSCRWSAVSKGEKKNRYFSYVVCATLVLWLCFILVKTFTSVLI